MKQIPNLFTLLNLFFGCLAVVFVLQSGFMFFSDEQNGQMLIDIPEKIWMASLFIGIAAVVDFLDGFVARLFNATSDMGKQLDSLADVVSFGVAPGMIVFHFLKLSLASHDDGLDTSIWQLLPAFSIPCAGAWRLARFNIDTGQTDSFKGLPIPAAGLFIASLPLIYWNNDQPWIVNVLSNEWFWYGLIIILSYLMVSSFTMMSFKFKNFRMADNLKRYILILAGAIFIFLFKWLALPMVIILYVILSLLFKNKTT